MSILRIYAISGIALLNLALVAGFAPAQQQNGPQPPEDNPLTFLAAPVHQADAFLSAIRKGEVATAHQQLVARQQKSIQLPALQRYIRQNGIGQHILVTWKKHQQVGGKARLQGVLTYRNGEQGGIDMIFTREDGPWKVADFKAEAVMPLPAEKDLQPLAKELVEMLARKQIARFLQQGTASMQKTADEKALTAAFDTYKIAADSQVSIQSITRSGDDIRMFVSTSDPTGELYPVAIDIRLQREAGQWRVNAVEPTAGEPADKEIVPPANKFFALLAQDKLEAAYDTLTKGVKRLEKARWSNMLRRAALHRHQQVRWKRKVWAMNAVTLYGDVRYQNGLNAQITLNLKRIDQQWRVESVHGSYTGVPVSDALPVLEEFVSLVRRKNFADARELVTSNIQQQFDLAAFTGFVRGNSLHNRGVIQWKPGSQHRYQMQYEGVFTTPAGVSRNLEIVVIWDGYEWRISGIKCTDLNDAKKPTAPLTTAPRSRLKSATI